MSIDPRRKTFSVTYCPRGQVEQQAQQGQRRSILDTLGNIGGLEGLGSVGEGLRTLSAVSNSVRSGSSVVPGREGDDTTNTLIGDIANTALDAVDSGANIVLDATGLGGVADIAGDFNPDVANRAVGQAKSIFQSVKQGNFELSDIPGVFSDLQNLEQLGRGIFGIGDNNRNTAREYSLCSASPYATDLISYAPKFNFLFVMDVQFSAPYADQWGEIGNAMAFVVKRSTRPSVEFEYEDVNMYNFWTKVPKKTIYPPVTMSFYDDNKNAAHLFYTAYMRAMSPIANIKADGLSQTGAYEQNSMNYALGSSNATFKESAKKLPGWASSLGPLQDNANSVIERIRLYHVFDYGRLMNIYNFYNPRIMTFTPSDLNMAETGDGAEFEFQFAYDGMFIEPGWSVQEGGENKNLEDKTSRAGGKYPIRPIFNDDDIPAQDNSQQPLAPIAQEQLGVMGDYVGNFTGDFLASDGAGGGASEGIAGAMNDAFGQVKQRASNAWDSATDFAGSAWDNVKSVFS